MRSRPPFFSAAATGSYQRLDLFIKVLRVFCTNVTAATNNPISSHNQLWIYSYNVNVRRIHQRTVPWEVILYFSFLIFLTNPLFFSICYRQALTVPKGLTINYSCNRVSIDFVLDMEWIGRE